MSKLQHFIKYGFFLMVVTIWLYFAIGVFAGTLRYDEVFMIQKGFGIAMFGDNPLASYAPPLFPMILSWLIGVFDGDLNVILVARFLCVILALLTIVMIYRYALQVVSKGDSLSIRLLIFAIAAAIGFYLAAMRSFELRPESIGNFLFLTSCGYLFVAQKLQADKRALLLSVCVIEAYFACNLSLRYVLPLFFVCSASVWLFLTDDQISHDEKRTTLAKIAASIVALVVVFHFSIYSIIELIEMISGIEDNREKMGLENKFFNLGLNKVSHSGYFFVEYYRVIALCFVLLAFFIAAFMQIANKQFRQLIALFLVGMSVASFYWVFAMEKQPFNYVLSVEAIVLLVLFLYCYPLLNSKLQYVYGVVIVLGLVQLSYESNIRIDNYRNGTDIVAKLNQSWDNRGQFKSFSDDQLHQYLYTAPTLLDQLFVRQIMCDRFAGNRATTNVFKFHPVCLQDQQSSDIQNKVITFESLNVDRQFVDKRGNFKVGYLYNSSSDNNRP